MTYVSCFYHAFAGAEQVRGLNCCFLGWACGPRDPALAACQQLEVLNGWGVRSQGLQPGSWVLHPRCAALILFSISLNRPRF